MVQKKRNAQLKKINSTPAPRQEPSQQEELPTFKLKDWFENNRQIVQSPVAKEEGDAVLRSDTPTAAFNNPADDLFRQGESFTMDRPDLAQLLYNLSRVAQPQIQQQQIQQQQVQQQQVQQHQIQQHQIQQQPIQQQPIQQQPIPQQQAPILTQPIHPYHPPQPQPQVKPQAYVQEMEEEAVAVTNDLTQLLHNHSFELWEDVQSPVSWKSKGVSREDNPTNVQKGQAALHMPADSSIYQFIHHGLRSNSVYQITFFARVGNRSLNVPLVASVTFYSGLGDQIGYETKIIVDPSIVETNYTAYKIIAEVPTGTQTARLNLSVPPSNSEDLGNYYIIDEVTFHRIG
ncbi:MAG: hypothetical protein ACXVP5_11580 [Tumebacillaceae bacterium]